LLGPTIEKRVRGGGRHGVRATIEQCSHAEFGRERHVVAAGVLLEAFRDRAG
jgi:hypothetical protein